MATLIKSVNKTSVKFTDTFTYTINAAFSEIVKSLAEGDLISFNFGSRTDKAKTCIFS